MALFPTVEAHRLKPSDVAERLNVRVETVRNWILKGELRAANAGGLDRPAYRISERSLEDFLTRRYGSSFSLRRDRAVND